MKTMPVQVTKDDLTSTLSSKITAMGREDKEDAFYVADLGDVVRKYKLWRSELPRVEPHYAVKCNEDPAVLAVLAELGTGFDCASKSEIQRIVDLKVSPSRIIYANPCKQTSHIRFAAKHGVSMMTFDNEVELHKIKAVYPTAQCVLRILPPDDTKAQCQLGMKYGCHPDHARGLLQVAKQLQLDVIGVSFHVGSGCWDATAFSSAVVSARAVFDIGEQEGFDFSLLDIGGGFPGQKRAKVSFQEICAELRPALDTCFPEESGVRIISEPGRFFVASAFTLAVNVIAKRTVTREHAAGGEAGSEEQHFMYYVNDGVYGSFNCLLYDHAEVYPELPQTTEGEELYSCSIWGPTCDGLDCVLEHGRLPELFPGSWVIFRDMGAYTLCAASNFNGMPKPTCYYTADEPYWQLLNAAYMIPPGPKVAAACKKNASLKVPGGTGSFPGAGPTSSPPSVVPPPLLLASKEPCYFEVPDM